MTRIIAGLALACMSQANAEVLDAPGNAAAHADVAQYAAPALREHLQERFDSVEVESVGRSGEASCAQPRFVSREMAPSPLAPRMLVIVRAECADGRSQTLPVWFKVKASADVQIAARDVPAGAQVTEADVRVAKVDITEVREKLLPAGATPVGMRAVVPLRAGTPITRARVRIEPDVVAQQPVLIRAGHGQVRIEAMGLALQNGRIGDRVQVVNLASGDTLRARVTDQRAVEVLQ